MSPRARAEEVLRFLGVEGSELLRELREEGLFEADELEAAEAEELRIATLLMRELGVNAAGVEVALHLRRRLLSLEAHVAQVIERMLDDLESR